jgi:hypothetical protein
MLTASPMIKSVMDIHPMFDSKVDSISKELQSKDMLIDIAIESVQGLIFFSQGTEKMAFQNHWKIQRKLRRGWIFIQCSEQSVKLREKDNLMSVWMIHLSSHNPQRSHLGSIFFTYC